MVRVPENVALVRRLHTLVFSRTKHCKIRSGTGTWLKFLISRHTRNPSAHAALFTKHGAILSGTSCAFSRQICADQRRRRLVRKCGIGSGNRLHWTFYPNRVLFSGTSTHFTRARTTFSVDPSTGKSLVRHG